MGTAKMTLQQVLGKHEEVFKEELGTLKGTKATIHVKPNAVPCFFRPRSVPYAMRAKVDKEMDRLLKEGIITPVKWAEWAAPVIPIVKPDGHVRLFGDYKLNVSNVFTGIISNTSNGGSFCSSVRRKTIY